MSAEQIISNRLIFIPFKLAIATSILKGDLKILEDIGLKTDKNWPQAEFIEILPKIIKNLELSTEPTGFESWIIVKQNNMFVIGDAGFKGQPNVDGGIDIGYGIIEKEQKKGYGFEAAKALVDWAFSHSEVNYITASCLINNIASSRILEKLGMLETSRDTQMIYWKIPKHSNTAY